MFCESYTNHCCFDDIATTIVSAIVDHHKHGRDDICNYIANNLDVEWEDVEDVYNDVICDPYYLNQLIVKATNYNCNFDDVLNAIKHTVENSLQYDWIDVCSNIANKFVIDVSIVEAVYDHCFWQSN